MDMLRSVVQPVTHNLPQFVHELGRSLLGPECYQTLALDVDMGSGECVGLAVSKALGLGIVAASSVVKVPQLIKLVRAQSGAGVSTLSYGMETASLVVSLAYGARRGYPFSTYGEMALIGLQNVAILALVLHLAGRSAAAAATVAITAAVFSALISDRVIDLPALAYLQVVAGVLGFLSKLPQIVTIWREGGTGQLSAFTVFTYLAGSVARIFTILREVDDPKLLYSYVAGLILNVVIAAQMAYYWNAPSLKARGKRRDIQKPSTSATAATSSSSYDTTRSGPRRRG